MGHVFRTETQQMAIDSLRRYLEAEVEPAFNKGPRDRFTPKEEMLGFMRRLSEFGLVSGAVGEEHGGFGLDWLTSTMLLEEVAAASVDLSVPVVINSSIAVVLANLAPDHLRERYLPKILSGDSLGSMAITEPDVGSNVQEIKTRARRDGDDWVINGEKVWISSGTYSDFLICTCRTNDDPRRGLTHILLDRHEHPYEVREIEKVAFNGQSTTQIFLNDVRVPVSNTIGVEGHALRNTLSLFERMRVYVAVEAVGLARRSLEEALRYTGERRQHGKVIAGHQLVAAMLAEMAVEVDAARLITYRAAEMVAAGLPAELEAAMAKYYAAEAAVKVARSAVQLHGANGISREFLAERLARESLIIPIYEGTSQIQKLIISRGLTGVAAF